MKAINELRIVLTDETDEEIKDLISQIERVGGHTVKLIKRWIPELTMKRGKE